MYPADGPVQLEGSLINHQRLGPAGLSLHYANVIMQIDTLVSVISIHCVASHSAIFLFHYFLQILSNCSSVVATILVVRTHYATFKLMGLLNSKFYHNRKAKPNPEK